MENWNDPQVGRRLDDGLTAVLGLPMSFNRITGKLAPDQTPIVWPTDVGRCPQQAFSQVN